jgi:hypothetical protein
MTAAAIARYLVEFDAAAEPRSGSAMPRPTATPSATGHAAAIDDAFARGIERGKAVAAADLDAKLAEQRAQSEKQLAAAREAWVLQEADRLSVQLTGGLKDMEERIAAIVARLLQPFLAEKLRSRAIAGLIENLNILLAQAEGTAVSVFGAPDLLEVLRARLGGELANVSYHPGQGSDVRVTVGQTVLETRLAGWIETIEETGR